jgi:hypothetical protein
LFVEFEIDSCCLIEAATENFTELNEKTPRCLRNEDTMAQAMEMSEESIEQYTATMRQRYARLTGKQARSVLLSEFVAVTGWSRKHANKFLGSGDFW